MGREKKLKFLPMENLAYPTGCVCGEAFVTRNKWSHHWLKKHITHILDDASETKMNPGHLVLFATHVRATLEIELMVNIESLLQYPWFEKEIHK